MQFAGRYHGTGYLRQMPEDGTSWLGLDKCLAILLAGHISEQDHYLATLGLILLQFD